MARHSGAALPAAATAAFASACVEFFMTPSTCWWSCGWTTLISAPPPDRRRPPMCALRSCCLRSSFVDLGLELLALGGAGRVGQVRLVDRSRRVGDGVHERDVVTGGSPVEIRGVSKSGPGSPGVAYHARSSSSVGVVGRVDVDRDDPVHRHRPRRTCGHLGDHARPARPGPPSSSRDSGRRLHQRGVLRVLALVGRRQPRDARPGRSPDVGVRRQRRRAWPGGRRGRS